MESTNQIISCWCNVPRSVIRSMEERRISQSKQPILVCRLSSQFRFRNKLKGNSHTYLLSASNLLLVNCCVVSVLKTSLSISVSGSWALEHCIINSHRFISSPLTRQILRDWWVDTKKQHTKGKPQTVKSAIKSGENLNQEGAAWVSFRLNCCE